MPRAAIPLAMTTIIRSAPPPPRSARKTVRRVRARTSDGIGPAALLATPRGHERDDEEVEPGDAARVRDARQVHEQVEDQDRQHDPGRAPAGDDARHRAVAEEREERVVE